MQDFSFCLRQLCPSESWAWRWRSCLACGDPGGSKCAGTRTATTPGVMALSESWSYGPIWVFFWASCSWQSEGLFGQSFSVAPPIQAHRGAPLTGVLLCRSVPQALKGAPWVGSYSEVQYAGIWRASLSIVQLPMLACGGREAMVMAPPPTCDSAVSPCFHGCPAFLHKLGRHFAPQSPPSHFLDLSLCSQQQPSP